MPAGALYEVFIEYVNFGSVSKDDESIDGTRFSRLIRQLILVDENTRLTLQDADVAFHQMLRKQRCPSRRLDFEHFQGALLLLAPLAFPHLHPQQGYTALVDSLLYVYLSSKHRKTLSGPQKERFWSRKQVIRDADDAPEKKGKRGGAPAGAHAAPPPAPRALQGAHLPEHLELPPSMFDAHHHQQQQQHDLLRVYPEEALRDPPPRRSARTPPSVKRLRREGSPFLNEEAPRGTAAQRQPHHMPHPFGGFPAPSTHGSRAAAPPPPPPPPWATPAGWPTGMPAMPPPLPGPPPTFEEFQKLFAEANDLPQAGGALPEGSLLLSHHAQQAGGGGGGGGGGGIGGGGAPPPTLWEPGEVPVTPPPGGYGSLLLGGGEGGGGGGPLASAPPRAFPRVGASQVVESPRSGTRKRSVSFTVPGQDDSGWGSEGAARGDGDEDEEEEDGGEDWSADFAAPVLEVRQPLPLSSVGVGHPKALPKAKRSGRGIPRPGYHTAHTAAPTFRISTRNPSRAMKDSEAHGREIQEGMYRLRQITIDPSKQVPRTSSAARRG